MKVLNSGAASAVSRIKSYSAFRLPHVAIVLRFAVVR
jgi:hypothetical protein